MTENLVVMTLDEYTNLVTTVERNNILIDALFDASMLDYNGLKLSIYGGEYDQIMKICLPDTYTARLHELQEKGKENATD